MTDQQKLDLLVQSMRAVFQRRIARLPAKEIVKEAIVLMETWVKIAKEEDK